MEFLDEADEQGMDCATATASAIGECSVFMSDGDIVCRCWLLCEGNGADENGRLLPFKSRVL